MSKFFFKGLFLLFFIFLFQNLSYATHIIGGEIMMQWLDGTRYRIILNKYVNEGSGQPVNDHETLDLFEKGTNYYITSITLDLISVNYLNINTSFCTDPTLPQNTLHLYMGELDLSVCNPNAINYLTWNECCRNQAINNLANPAGETIALYTEFHGQGNHNSSPMYPALSNEYFCRNSLNVFDLSATDPDGDVLVYSLVAPRSVVYPSSVDVVWYGSSSYSNPIPGSVPFTLNANTGVASFNPSGNGIFVFGMMVEEYRNGQKIGEVRKDFQLIVQDCPTNNKPVVAFQNRAIQERDTLTVSLKGATCFPIYVTDYDATQLFISENILIHTQSTLPQNSTITPYPIAGYTLPDQVTINGLRDTAWFNACFNPCAGGLRLDETAYYPFTVVISDNRCPAQYDTLIFTIKIDVASNSLPEVAIDPPSNPKSVKVNDPLTFKVYGSDADVTDLLSLTIANPQRGMSFTNVQDSSSTISSTFSWQPNCNDLHPGTYDVYFIVKDNSCTSNSADTVHQTILVYQNEVSFDSMLVTNLITPNGDGMNDYYHLPGIPEGNCDKYFKGIEIYNRWGSRVFYSQDPGFKWYPNVSDGVYYFSIDLNYEVRKGWLQVTQ